MVGGQLRRLDSDSGSWPLRITAAIYLLFALGAVVYSWRTGNFSLTTALLLAVPLFAAGCFPFLLTRQPATSVGLMAAMTVVALIVVMYRVAPTFAEHESSRRLLRLAAVHGYSQTAIYGMQRSDRTPEFYAAGRVVYRADGEPIMYEGPAQVIEESRRRKETLLTFVPLGELWQLTEMSSAQTEVIGDNVRDAIVAVRAR